jgi:hypothetical protein
MIMKAALYFAVSKDHCAAPGLLLICCDSVKAWDLQRDTIGVTEKAKTPGLLTGARADSESME